MKFFVCHIGKNKQGQETLHLYGKNPAGLNSLAEAQNEIRRLDNQGPLKIIEKWAVLESHDSYWAKGFEGLLSDIPSHIVYRYEEKNNE